MLHYLDDLDSKMEAVRAQFERGGESEGAWTGYNPSLGRPLLNTAKFMAEKPSEEEEEEGTATEASVSGKMVAAEGTLAGVDPEPAEKDLELEGKEAEKEKSSATMTSAAHEDKI